MAKRMLVDATHPEETRVVVVNGNRLEELDFEIATRKQLKGNIYLAKVTRVEPSLQAAFVEYGGNRHGFLAFSEIHPDYYRIPVADREALIAEEERRYRDSDEREEPAGRAMAEAVQPIEMVEHQSPMPSPIAESEDGENDDSAYADAEGVAYTSEAPSEAGQNDTERAPANDSAAETAAPGENVDVVGGDEVEEAHRRRLRPLRSYKIQEVIKRRQIMLVQVTKEERGNKGAALTTYLSLPGRYCVLMPNTGRGGGISRKITNPADRKRLKEILSDLDIPDGMAVILRTAGLERSKQEIKRDLEYLLRLWDDIREQTLNSTAPTLIYEEANLIKRSIRDIYSNDIDEIWVEGDAGYRTAKDFMRMLMPSHAKRVQPYREEAIPLFHRYQVEPQIDAIHNPVVHLKSGGYIVINPTEALVAIDVNSGKSTRERNIEETAYKTNLEAAEEVARQLRLRDLAGLIVIDFIDMEDPKNNASVERRLKEAMKNDRARIQLGRISPFGLLELSRQRLRPSLLETNFERCAHCSGTGVVRSVESAALHVLRHIEEEGIRKRSAEITVYVPTAIALYILNQKRTDLARIEMKYGFRVLVQADDTLIAPDLRLERIKARQPGDEGGPLVSADRIMAETDRVLAVAEAEDAEEESEDEETEAEAEAAERPVESAEGGERRRRRRRRRRGRGDREMAEQRPFEAGRSAEAEAVESEDEAEGEEAEEGVEAAELGDNGDARKKRRRGKRGGRRRSRQRELMPGETAEGIEGAEGEAPLGEEQAAEEAEVPSAPTPKPRVRAIIPPPPVPPAPALEAIDFDLILSGEQQPAAETPAEEASAPEAAAPDVTAEVPAAAPPEAAADTAVDTPKPKKRPSRSRKAAAAEPEAVPAPVPEAAPEAPARKTRSRKKAVEPVAEAPAPEAPAEEAKPKKRPSRSRKTAKPASAAPAPEVLTEPVVEEVAAVAAPEGVPETAPAEAPQPEENTAARAAEVINPPTEKPRRGWWNRLMS
ncbi:MAG TPA: ribonuclease E/G [Azospirillum sp.]|nr:ribonuclease E/G [Azospirillum sp.]